MLFRIKKAIKKKSDEMYAKSKVPIIRLKVGFIRKKLSNKIYLKNEFSSRTA